MGWLSCWYQLFLSVLAWTDLRTPQEYPATAPCIYEVFEDNACLGTVLCDHPQSIENILRRLGRAHHARLADYGSLVPCGSSIWLSRNSSEMMVRAISGGKLMAAGKKIDVNRAQASNLKWVPGIGPTLAKRIVQERERRNGFTSMSDLRTIRGIGKKKWEALTQWLEVSQSLGSARFRMAPDHVDHRGRSASPANAQGPRLSSPINPADADF